MKKRLLQATLALTATGLYFEPNGAIKAEAREMTSILVIDTGHLPAETTKALSEMGITLAAIDTGHILALKTESTGHILATYDATYDEAGHALIFSGVDMTLTEGLIKTSAPRIAHGLNDGHGHVFSIDARLIALALAENGEAKSMVPQIEGRELTFVPPTGINKAKAIDLTTSRVLGKMFGAADIKGEMIVTKLKPAGQTFIAMDNIGHLNDGELVNIDVTALAAFGLSVAAVPPATVGHLATAAA